MKKPNLILRPSKRKPKTKLTKETFVHAVRQIKKHGTPLDGSAEGLNLPWKCEAGRNDSTLIINNIGHIVGCTLFPQQTEYITKSANSHDNLMNALKIIALYGKGNGLPVTGCCTDDAKESAAYIRGATEATKRLADMAAEALKKAGVR